eukprot:365181-Chlamydomonas_euryale.AAC.6
MAGDFPQGARIKGAVTGQGARVRVCERSLLQASCCLLQGCLANGGWRKLFQMVGVVLLHSPHPLSFNSHAFSLFSPFHSHAFSSPGPAILLHCFHPPPFNSLDFSPFLVLHFSCVLPTL